MSIVDMTADKLAVGVAGSVPPDRGAGAYAAGAGLATLITDIHRTTNHRWSRRVAVDVVCAADAVIIVLASLVPALIYTKTFVVKAPALLSPAAKLAATAMATPWLAIIQTGAIAALIACGALRNWGMYNPERVHDLPAHPGRLLAALALAFLAVLGLGNPFSAGHPMLWIWYAAWASTSFTLLLSNRLLARAVLKHFTAAGRFETRVAVFGAGSIARRVRDHLANPELGLRFAGVYDDRVDDARVGLQTRGQAESISVTGKLDTLIKAARMGRIDQIVVALPQSADRRAAMVLRKLEALPVSVHLVTHISSDLLPASAAHHVSSLGPIGLLDVKRRPLADWAPLLKAVEDYVLGSLLLVLSMPMMALIALATKLDSLGPVLVSERRRGLDAQVFRVWRFRTTHVDGDGRVTEVRGHDAGALADPNMTRLGRGLRSSGLDKLPQLLNVLRGEMSLVGPAPYELAEPCRSAQILEDHANRYRVKPGITGAAVLPGTPGEHSFEAARARADIDMEHISHWSLRRDLRLLGRAIWG
jgi:lipopolysaccharide/colanic/teichoic acid biosynthesis glycosyltransferase